MSRHSDELTSAYTSAQSERKIALKNYRDDEESSEKWQAYLQAHNAEVRAWKAWAEVNMLGMQTQFNTL